MNVVEIIKLGQRYLKLWPEKSELGQYFDDYQAVQSGRFVCRYFPALALFTFIMQLYVSSGYPVGSGSIDKALMALPQALVYGLFLVSIPVQALVLSGVKADKFLPPSLASWYRESINKAKEQNSASISSEIKAQTSKPRYIDLAQLLSVTFSNQK